MIAQPPIAQIAWVVPELASACRAWHCAHGIGPFFVSRNLPVDGALHRGRPCETRFSTAIAQCGSVQIELIEQHDDRPSVYRDTVSAGASAFHHVARIVADFDGECARLRDLGHAVASEGRVGDMRFAYFDTTATLGHMVEVIEDREGIRRFFDAVRRAAEAWDGDPGTLIREAGRADQPGATSASNTNGQSRSTI